MENPDIDRPAVHIGFPFFAALFVASFFGAPFAAVSAVLLFAAVFLLFLFKQHRQRPNFVLSLIATAAAFAVFAVAMHLFVLPTERYDGGTYTVTGNVESFLTKSNGRFYYKLHVTHIDEPVQDVDFSVRLSHSEAFPAEIGDTVTCEAKFFAFEDSLGLSPRTSWLADNMVLSAYGHGLRIRAGHACRKAPVFILCKPNPHAFSQFDFGKLPQNRRLCAFRHAARPAGRYGNRACLRLQKGRCFAHFGHIRHAHGDLNAVHPRFSGSARAETPPSRTRFRGVYAAFYVRLGAFGLCGAQQALCSSFCFSAFFSVAKRNRSTPLRLPF